MAVIAIDLGATVCKAAIFDGGRMLGYCCRHHDYTCPEDGWAEQDASQVWSLVSRVVKECLAGCQGNPKVEALSVSVQGDAIIPIDSAGNPLHAAILGMDTRSYREAFDLEDRFGSGPLYAATGMPCKPLNAITKILWLERNHPELRKRLWKYVHYGEFLLMKLAGIPAVDFSMASRSMAFDPVVKDWVPSILDYVGIGPGQLGNVTPSGVPIGIIRKAVADEWGINRNALLVAGSHNQCMAAIGAGVIEPHLACYSMGTAEVISTSFGSPKISPAMLEANYPCYCHAVADQYFTITLNQSGGLSLEWFHHNIRERASDDEAAFARSLAQVRLKPSPVLFLPHLVGSGTPTCDHRSRGAFIGMSIKTSQVDLLQAVVDAQAFEARLNLETLDNLGIVITDLRAVDWGAKETRILELKATVLNRPIRTLRTPEAALLGTAMLTQTAVGQFPDLASACNECVQIACTIEPNPRAKDEYQESFERFRQLYGTLKSFYRHWHSGQPAYAAV